MKWVWFIVLFLSVACGGSDGGDREQGARTAQHEAHEVASSGSAALPDADGTNSPVHHPDTPKDVVIALIEAFQTGDQAAVEALWARDGGTWTDAAGFRERAAYYQKAEFDLDPKSIEVNTSQGAPMVIVRARQDGQDFIWRFLITKIDGTLRAGGVEAYPAGMP